MDFDLTPSQQMTRRAVREFVRNEVTPSSQQLDEAAEFPQTLYKKALALDVMDITLPEVLDGIGEDYLSFVIALEEFACGSAALAHCIAAAEALVYLLSRHGSQQQQDRYLRRLLKGQSFGAAAIWVPDEDSRDAGDIRAVAEASGYRLNGTLHQVPLAPAADVVAVFAAVEGEGIDAFLVNTQTPEVATAKSAELMGVRGFPLSRLELTDVFLSADQRLGGKGSGQQIADALLARSETAAGAIAVGISQAALEAAVRHSKARVQFGKPLAQMQATQNKIADMAAGIQSARLLVCEAACCLEKDKSPVRQTAAAKLVASQLAVKICREAVQLHGGYGYIKDYPVERLYRDALFSRVFPTANEAQRCRIARQAYRKIR